MGKSIRVPLSYRLIEFVIDQIQSGNWKAGERIPSEDQLCEQFKVSRTTVRAALTELIEQGLIYRLHGKGTFVSRPSLQQRLNRLTGFTMDMQSRGLEPSSQVLSAVVIPIPPIAASSLQIKTGYPVIMLQRLRLANGTPMAFETSYIIANDCEGVLNEDFSKRSLYGVLAEKLQIIPTRAVQEMRAIPCPLNQAKYLEIQKGEPVLQMIRTAFDQNDRPFERVESIYRGDRYVFYAELTNTR